MPCETNVSDLYHEQDKLFRFIHSTHPGSFKLTDISYRLRFSFVSFACIVHSFFVFRSFAFRSCNWFVHFVHRLFRVSFVSFIGLIRRTNETRNKRTNNTRNERTNDTRSERANDTRYTIHDTNYI
jgi:hypothetical protein